MYFSAFIILELETEIFNGINEVQAYFPLPYLTVELYTINEVHAMRFMYVCLMIIYNCT